MFFGYFGFGGPSKSRLKTAEGAFGRFCHRAEATVLMKGLKIEGSRLVSPDYDVEMDCGLAREIIGRAWTYTHARLSRR